MSDKEDTKAAAMWSKLTENEKTGVRFGMVPARKMLEAKKEGFDGLNLCCALMECAKKNGGMRA